ncbi:MAG TPA: phosphatase PAP2 family protein [Gemmatimonadaceae bacterium]|nr:phosphatase PAP2 family protein [Gemmatimonadaceae bacterium]
MRTAPRIVLVLLLVARALAAQEAQVTSHGDKTFLTRRDLLTAGLALGATAVLSRWDTDIAQASQKGWYQDSSTHNFADKVSKVNETTLTLGGLLVYGVGRLSHSNATADIALHATEAVVLASLASQVIRGPLGRARPYVTNDTDQYSFTAFKGFGNFTHRAFPSIHTSSSMAVATVLTMETHRRHPGATPFVAPVLFAAGLLPGLARIDLNQHWASDIAAGAFMGVFAGYKVTKYSHDHPGNRFDRVLLHAMVMPGPNGAPMVGFNFQ